jgi:hypothetical protein
LTGAIEAKAGRDFFIVARAFGVWLPKYDMNIR